jgi:hypothetical protein
MIRIKTSSLEMDIGNDNDGKERRRTNNVDSRCIRSDCIKEGSLYRTKMDTKEKGICQITYIGVDTKSKKVVSSF